MNETVPSAIVDALLEHDCGIKPAADRLAKALQGFLGDGDIEKEIRDARKALQHYWRTAKQ